MKAFSLSIIVSERFAFAKTETFIPRINEKRSVRYSQHDNYVAHSVYTSSVLEISAKINVNLNSAIFGWFLGSDYFDADCSYYQI